MISKKETKGALKFAASADAKGVSARSRMRLFLFGNKVI